MNIFVVARSMIDVEGIARFLEHEGARWRRPHGVSQQEELVELAGRVCYMSFGERQSGRQNFHYIQNLIVQGHESVLEHVSWTFMITGISRALSHQVVRHRIGFSYSQLSQQYHEESEASWVLPHELKDKPALFRIWQEAVEASHGVYQTLLTELRKTPVSELDRKEFLRSVRSAARSLLPNAMETKIVATVNARALRHFFKVRGEIEGDYEMRALASGLLEAVKEEAPALFQDFYIETLGDGSPIVRQSGLEHASRDLAVAP